MPNKYGRGLFQILCKNDIHQCQNCQTLLRAQQSEGLGSAQLGSRDQESFIMDLDTVVENEEC